MSDLRAEKYAEGLSRLISMETVSFRGQTDKSKFYAFHEVLKELYPHLFAVCEFQDFNGSILLRWKGSTDEAPILLMNHFDVVEAPGEWKYPPFSGTVAEGRVWGRGTVDTKGGLWGMLQAAEELAAEGFVPRRDTWFMSTCTEECDGSDANRISQLLQEQGIRFYMTLDEGGMIVKEPFAGTTGDFAMVGVGEKGFADLKFIARSTGGHASTPGKNTPLVCLGKFMAAAEKGGQFKAYISPTVRAMFSTFASTMKGPLKFVLKHSRLFNPLLLKVMPMISGTANAMVRTTLAFTMASGSKGANVLPQEAWVIANMRYSHHQGGPGSIEAITKLAAKFNVETEVLEPGFPSPLSDYRSEPFDLVRKAVAHAYPDVTVTPYVMTAASDSRFMSRVSDNCLRFAPFRIDNQQLGSVHGLDENINVSTLPAAVDFYRYIITEA